MSDVTTGNHAIVNFRTVPDASKFALLISTPTRIGDLFWMDKANGQPRQLTRFNEELFSKLNLTEPEEIWHNSFDGRKIQVWVQKPPDFDPNKKYPLMVYIYEELTQGLHSFNAPNVATSINIPRYVSNGYVLLRPDIVYTTGYPGEAAEKCVIPAVNTVVDMGFIDPKRQVLRY